MTRQSTSNAQAVALTRQRARAVWFTAAMLTLTAAAALFALNAGAQTPAADTASPATAQAATAPKYAAQDVERVFSYLDKNQDGKISREEGAAFKNIASHFDGADANKDNSLSREEFESAVNGGKPH
ncbi:MAG: putative signal transduction protein with EFhand domain [Polaromonas sp.]|nr:putative signal transduction protein with EFhand domain [Polaromonas sp.]